MTAPEVYDSVVSELSRLTQEDLLVWAYEIQGDYVGHYQQRVFRLNCFPKTPRFTVDNQEYPIKQEDIALLCNLIAQQAMRRLHPTGDLNSLNNWLSANDERHCCYSAQK
jgi:hypothetical protein